MALADKAFRLATTRMQDRRRGPTAVAVRYAATASRIRVDHSIDLELGFAPALIEGLGGATLAQLADIEVSPAGFGLHFPQLGADVYLSGLLESRPAWLARVDGQPPRCHGRQGSQPGQSNGGPPGRREGRPPQGGAGE